MSHNSGTWQHRMLQLRVIYLPRYDKVNFGIKNMCLPRFVLRWAQSWSSSCKTVEEQGCFLPACVVSSVQEAVRSSVVTNLASTCCWSAGSEIPSAATDSSAPARPPLTPPASGTVRGAAGSWGQEETKDCGSEKTQGKWWGRWSTMLPAWVYSARWVK